MSTNSTASPVLSALERRVLGVLVEKAMTTPDVYPLSLNGVVTGCNQKSNRDPVMNVEEPEVDDTLERLQKTGFVIKVVPAGGRVEKWRHNLYDALSLTKADTAILAELLLRALETEGELRSRVARMHETADLEELRSLVKNLSIRKYVVYLTPENRRGTMVTHSFHSPEEFARLRALHSTGLSGADVESASVSLPPARHPIPSELEGKLDRALERITHLETELAALQKRFAEFEKLLS